MTRFLIQGVSVAPGMRSAGLSATFDVTGDQLIGHVVEVVADDLRLRHYAKDIVADALDQGRFPAGRHRAERVPGMAGDEAHLWRSGAQLLLDIGVGLARRLVVLDAIRAETPFEQVDNAAMLELA